MHDDLPPQANRRCVGEDDCLQCSQCEHCTAQSVLNDDLATVHALEVISRWALGVGLLCACGLLWVFL